MQPRLLYRKAATAYCGVLVGHFLAEVDVAPVQIGSKRLRDVRALDRWIDGLDKPGQVAQPDQWVQAMETL